METTLTRCRKQRKTCKSILLGEVLQMKDFLKNIAALIKVKTIVTLVVVAVFAALALREKLQPDTVMTIVTMVVAFYFGTQSERKG
uniref:Putative DMT superfamily protein n=1 Tax=Ackermannviridae sp. TaxID=2831612 RepID=A0A8S5VPZ9_9CAUD|nr:MAG TPA: putative DMT superfamily protein [Ackermannviridae sp.]